MKLFRCAVLLLALGVAIPGLHSQDFGTGAQTSTAQASTAHTKERSDATAALDAHDFDRALKLLAPLAQANPKDARILFDLASAQDALDQTTAAEQSYRAAIQASAGTLGPHVALGLLYARNGRLPEARAELRMATTLPGSDSLPEDKLLKARAFRALARIDSKTEPAKARDDLLEALKLSPETREDALLSAELAQSATNGEPAAEAAYRRLLAAHPGDEEATAALAHLLRKEKRGAEAEKLLTAALTAHPGDVGLTVELATTYAGEGKTSDALPLVEAVHVQNPQDAAITHLLANLYLATKDYGHAESLLSALSVQNPQDMTLLADRADAQIHLRRFGDAQGILARAVAQPTLFPSPADFGAAAGMLAFAASENNDPSAVLQALALRATVLTPSATTLFLAAISHDKLHHVKLATQAYKQFLLAAKGALPDQEFEAQHRLVALEHMK